MSRRFIGGLYGRAIGRVLIHFHGGVPTDPFWMWIDPGAMALIGAASFFAGVSRLTMSLTVIMVRTISSALNIRRQIFAFWDSVTILKYIFTFAFIFANKVVTHRIIYKNTIVHNIKIKPVQYYV